MQRETSKWVQVSQIGQVWVCGACGRIGRGRRMDMGDTSCVLWAVLCEEASLVLKDGLAVSAKAVDDAP
jgi:hypothetical protein